MPRTPFSVELKGSFYTFELYDAKGRSVYTLTEAVEAADDVYGTEWVGVFNGEEGAENGKVALTSA